MSVVAKITPGIAPHMSKSTYSKDSSCSAFVNLPFISLNHAQGTALQGLPCLESVSLLTTAGYLGFELRGLPDGVRDMRLTSTELQGSINADHKLQTLRLDSGRALEITIEPARDDAVASSSSAALQVPSTLSVRRRLSTLCVCFALAVICC